MLAATMVKMSNSENKYMNKNTYNISSIKRVTRKFLEVSCCSHAKQWQRNIEKSVLHVKSCFFAYQTYCCFHRSQALPSPLKMMLHETICNNDFYRNKALQHCFEWLQHCSSIATLCSAKNRRCESSRVTSPLALHYFIFCFASLLALAKSTYQYFAYVL